MASVPNRVSQMQNVTHRLLPEAIASVLTSQPKEINRHIDGEFKRLYLKF